MIRVLLADDQALLRAGFGMLLAAADDIEVVAEAANGGAAVALAREHRPDVVLMDLRMPDVDGLTATGLITSDPALAAVRVVARGDALLSPSVTRAVIAQFTSGRQAAPAPGPSRPAPPGLAALTEREREVVCLVAAGLSNDEIATKLTVSPLTVKTHVSRAMTKLYARDRAQLVVLAFENGLVARPAS